MADSSDATAPHDGQRRADDKPAEDDDSKGLEAISSDEDEASYAEPKASASTEPESQPPSSPPADPTDKIGDLPKADELQSPSATSEETLPVPKDDDAADKPGVDDAPENVVVKNDNDKVPDDAAAADDDDDVTPGDVALKNEEDDVADKAVPVESEDAVDSAKKDPDTDAVCKEANLPEDDKEEEPMEVDSPPRVEDPPSPMDVTLEEEPEQEKEKVEESAEKNSSDDAEAVSPASDVADKEAEAKKVTESVDEVDAAASVTSPKDDVAEEKSPAAVVAVVSKDVGAENVETASVDKTKNVDADDSKDADISISASADISKDVDAKFSKEADAEGSKDTETEVSKVDNSDVPKDIDAKISKDNDANESMDTSVDGSKDSVSNYGESKAVSKDVDVNDPSDADKEVKKAIDSEESKDASAEDSVDDTTATDDVVASSSRPHSAAEVKNEIDDADDDFEMITAEVEMGEGDQDDDITIGTEDSRPTSSSSKTKGDGDDEKLDAYLAEPEVVMREPGDVVEQIETGSGPVIIKVCALEPGQEEEEEADEEGTDKTEGETAGVSADDTVSKADKGEAPKGDGKKKKVSDAAKSTASMKGEQAEVDDDDDGEEAATSGDGEDMPTLAIMDVRTVTEEETGETAAGSGESSAAPKVKGKSKGADDSDMKNYAADTMNELLGLFGYEKVDETMKDAIQLSNNLSGPGEKAGVKFALKKAVEGGRTVTVKSGQGRTCSVCSKTRSCKYQVLMLGTTKFLCDDNCFREFRTKQNITAAPAVKDIIAENRPVTRSITHPKDHCNQCHKEIRNGQGLLPGVGENKPLCSEECMRNYQSAQGLKRGCAQCGCQIQSRSKCLTWEAMEFCNEECLGKYQSYLGSHCAYCNHAVQQTSLGKYCVRFGSDIKQFCSNGCLEEFKKGLKVCSYCQKDISSGAEGFLAPVGDKGQFKEFCSQSCMEKYETMGNVTPIQPTIEQCSVCSKVATVKVEVTFDSKVHKLCSEPCIAAFRYANKINTSICDTCHKFFDLDVSQQLTIQFEGTSKRFCTKACMNVFVLYHRKVVPCSWCKVKKYNFDMIERVDSNNHVQLFCSLNCLSLFRVSLNATSSRKVQCDFCHHSKPAQYHLTMSDASIRNFCSYNCVMQFQGQFTTLAPVVNAPTAPGTALTTTNTQTTGTPVISAVMSLAPAQGSGTQTTAAPKSLIIRPPVVVPVTATKPIIPVRAMSTQTMVPAITQQVLVRNPPAKSQKNKTLMCKPMTQTKGVSCKPHPCHKTTQTEEDFRKPFLIPVPVPIFIPVPMRMFTTPVPYPLPFPLPIPVPVFIPTTRNSAQGIFKQIREIQHKIPDNPFEADLILMAEMVADEESSAKDGAKSGAKLKAIAPASPQSNLGSPEPDDESSFPVGSHLPDGGGAFGDDVLQMALRMASGMDEPVDLETALAAAAAASEQHHVAPVLVAEENGAGASYLSPRELRGQSRVHNKRSSSGGGRGRGRGRKRARTSDRAERERSPPPSPPAPILPPQFDMMAVGPPRHESNCVLKFSYGVNAWKHWVLHKNTQLEKASQSNRKLKLFKTDLLQLVADELNYSLCLFVKEVRKPNGEEYAPDSIYYLCLGIQQYLFENGRIDNIFADAYYEKFTECLNEVLQRYDVTIANDGCFISRIEEEILWECKQLGAHSPHVLLNTLMYFNTKFFMLKTIDDHMQLSFTHILKHWKKTPGAPSKASAAAGRNVLLRYYPSSSQTNKDASRKRKESSLCYEQVENLENPLRCPVKLYEFYLSKCPESIKNRSDVFYLYPERSCVPDSPVWYSTMSLGKETIAKMLQRIRMIM